MLPAIAPGDRLLVDPTTRHWPRRGSVVVVREPDSGDLAIKRVAAGPGDRVPFADGYLILAEDEAWLLADADEETTRAAGFGEPIDSRRYGPVPLDLLVGRAWFRYGPAARLWPDPASLSRRDPDESRLTRTGHECARPPRKSGGLRRKRSQSRSAVAGMLSAERRPYCRGCVRDGSGHG